MIRTVLLLIFIFPLQAQGSDKVVSWPDLKDIKYITGRAATENDITNGSAVFLLQSDGEPIGKPIDINLPQYALHTDAETNIVTKVIIIQAEEDGEREVLGAIIIKSNEYIVGLFNEFKLLGSEMPNE